jgi:hypothetical protein
MSDHRVGSTPNSTDNADRRPRLRHRKALVLLRSPLLAPAASPRSSSPGQATLWRRWTGWATAGEFVGFGVPALTAALVAAWSAGAAMPLLVVAGAVEGTMLGLAQAHVLRGELPTLNDRRWVLATAVGAAAAWAIGLLPMLTDGRIFDLPIPVLVPIVTVFAAALLGSIGTAQWLVLRPLMKGSWVWILTTAGAWVAGLLVFTAVATPLWQPGQSTLEIALIGILGGLVMAATVAAISGWALVRLLRTPATQSTAGRR